MIRPRLYLSADRRHYEARTLIKDRRFGLWLTVFGVFLMTFSFYGPLALLIGSEHASPTIGFGMAVVALVAGLLGHCWRLHVTGLAVEARAYTIGSGDWVMTVVAGVISGMAAGTFGARPAIVAFCVVLAGFVAWLGAYVTALGYQLAGYSDEELRHRGSATGWPPGRKYRPTAPSRVDTGSLPPRD